MSLMSLMSLRIVPMFLKFSNLPNLSNFLLLPNFPSIIGRARYFRNPQSVVPAISPEAKPRDTSPAEAGAWGWVRFGIAFVRKQVS